MAWFHVLLLAVALCSVMVSGIQEDQGGQGFRDCRRRCSEQGMSYMVRLSGSCLCAPAIDVSDEDDAQQPKKPKTSE